MFRDKFRNAISLVACIPFFEMRCKIKKMFLYSWLKTWLNKFNVQKKLIFCFSEAWLTFWHFAEWRRRECFIFGQGWGRCRILKRNEPKQLFSSVIAKCWHFNQWWKVVKKRLLRLEISFFGRTVCFKRVAAVLPTGQEDASYGLRLRKKLVVAVLEMHIYRINSAYYARKQRTDCIKIQAVRCFFIFWSFLPEAAVIGQAVLLSDCFSCRRMGGKLFSGQFVICVTKNACGVCRPCTTNCCTSRQ